MRVISGLVLAGWLVGGVATPCLVRDGCASPARHECRCGHASDCCCRLTPTRAPVSSSNIATLPAVPDLLGLTASVTSVLLAGIQSALEGGAALATDAGRLPSLPLFLSSRAFRC